MRISLSNKDVMLLSICKELLEEFGIKSYLRKQEDIEGASCSRLEFGKKETVDIFFKQIGFTIKRKKREV
jgi:4-hydroxy-3-methylbut-2-en-1-yl diphosphate synthase IspG/GcpE